MEQSVKALPWMDEPTRKAALEKLTRIANKIGFPDKPRSYDALVTQPGSHQANLSAASAFEPVASLQKLASRATKRMADDPPTVNAYYEPLFNEMAFPAGILQPPMFGRGRRPRDELWRDWHGHGHEVTHGFDDEAGASSTPDGNLRDWWSQSVNTEFNRLARPVRRRSDTTNTSRFPTPTSTES